MKPNQLPYASCAIAIALSTAPAKAERSAEEIEEAKMLAKEFRVMPPSYLLAKPDPRPVLPLSGDVPFPAKPEDYQLDQRTPAERYLRKPVPGVSPDGTIEADPNKDKAFVDHPGVQPRPQSSKVLEVCIDNDLGLPMQEEDLDFAKFSTLPRVAGGDKLFVTYVQTAEGIFPEADPFLNPPGTNLLPTINENMRDRRNNEMVNTLPSQPNRPYNLHDGEPVVSTLLTNSSPTDDLRYILDTIFEKTTGTPMRRLWESRNVDEAETILNNADHELFVKNRDQLLMYTRWAIDLIEGNDGLGSQVPSNRAYRGFPLLNHSGHKRKGRVTPILDANGRIVGGNLDVHQIWYDGRIQSDTMFYDFGWDDLYEEAFLRKGGKAPTDSKNKIVWKHLTPQSPLCAQEIVPRLTNDERKVLATAIVRKGDAKEQSRLRNLAVAGKPDQVMSYLAPIVDKALVSMATGDGKASATRAAFDTGVWYRHDSHEQRIYTPLPMPPDVPWTVTYKVDVMTRGEDDFSPTAVYMDYPDPFKLPKARRDELLGKYGTLELARLPEGERKQIREELRRASVAGFQERGVPFAKYFDPELGAPVPGDLGPWHVAMDQTFFPMEVGTSSKFVLKMAPPQYYNVTYTWGWRKHPPRAQATENGHKRIPPLPSRYKKGGGMMDLKEAINCPFIPPRVLFSRLRISDHERLVFEGIRDAGALADEYVDEILPVLLNQEGKPMRLPDEGGKPSSEGKVVHYTDQGKEAWDRSKRIKSQELRFNRLSKTPFFTPYKNGISGEQKAPLDMIGDLSPAKRMWRSFHAVQAAIESVSGDETAAEAKPSARRCLLQILDARNAYLDWQNRSKLPSGLVPDEDADLTILFVNNTIYGEMRDSGADFAEWKNRHRETDADGKNADLRVCVLNGDHFPHGYVNVDFGANRGWENQFQSTLALGGGGSFFSFGRFNWRPNVDPGTIGLPPAVNFTSQVSLKFSGKPKPGEKWTVKLGKETFTAGVKAGQTLEQVVQKLVVQINADRQPGKKSSHRAKFISYAGKNFNGPAIWLGARSGETALKTVEVVPPQTGEIITSRPDVVVAGTEGQQHLFSDDGTPVYDGKQAYGVRPFTHRVWIRYHHDPGRRLRFYQFDPMHHDAAIFSIH